ncbi:MAG: MBL fold metallo-hydrolase [Thermodesulfobacteriota bacterium]|nr:MBL fold metallo-hydrolase [Thermodesulfobacteriota bacterium]
MQVETVVVTEFMTNCFIVSDEETKKALVIDPGGDAHKILNKINSMDIEVIGIVDTHGHVDHVGANREIRDTFGVEVMLHRLDLPMLQAASKMATMFGVRIEQPPDPERFIAEGDIIRMGNTTFKVIETPGHSPGGISLMCSDNKHCIVGDTLFMGSIGRTDLPGGDYNTLIQSIKTKILPMGDEIVVLTGHGPATTIGTERKHNPFL